MPCKNCGTEVPEGASYCPKCGMRVDVGAELRLASWGERFVAWLIDVVIVGAFLTLARFMVGSAWPSLTPGPDFLSWIPFLDVGPSSVAFFSYWTFMEGFYGQSLGKLIMKLEVTGLSGRPPSISHIAIESIGKAFILVIDLIIGWIFCTRKRQRLFNYISSTIVVKTYRSQLKRLRFP